MFLNVVNKSDFSIIKIDVDLKNLKNEDIIETVLQKYCVTEEAISFYDSDSGITIPITILSDYIKDKLNTSTKWILGISIKIAESIEVSEVNFESTQNNELIQGESSTIFESTQNNELVQGESSTIYRTISFNNATQFNDYIHVNQIVKETFSSAESLENINDLDLKIILNLYKHNERLDNNERIILSKIVIKTLLNRQNNLELTRIDFQYLAKIICLYFRKEVTSTYYTTGVRAQKPAGKLYDSYCSYRKKLSSAGIIRRRPKLPSTTISFSDTSQPENDFQHLKFLKENTEPFVELKKCWEKSFSDRSKILNNPNISTAEYLENFLIFSTGNSAQHLELFKIDAEKIIGKISNLADSYEFYYKKILIFGKRSNNRTVQSYIKLIDSCDKETIKWALSLLILPYVFPQTRNIKRRKYGKSLRTTKLESQENFVAYFKTIQQAEEFEKNLNIQNKGLQPRAVFFGDVENNLKGYVTLIDKKYYFEDPIDVITNCFYIFYSLNIQYPEESAYIWMFVQKYIFNITIGVDKKTQSIIPSIESVNNDLINL